VIDSIETNAATWARLIAAGEVPGYRAQRDAYCAAGGASASVGPSAGATTLPR
jgi:hypothetical protein